MGSHKRFHWSVDIDAVIVWGGFIIIAAGMLSIPVILWLGGKI